MADAHFLPVVACLHTGVCRHMPALTCCSHSPRPTTSTASLAMVLTLFNLENSRAFRVLWLANELGVPLQVRNYARIGGKKAVGADRAGKRVVVGF